MPLFIVEHLEKKIHSWCVFEYSHIIKKVGKENVFFTNIKSKLNANYAKNSIHKLKFKNACILDPESKIQLTPKIAKKFDVFIFGGILGDYPPRKRTKEELKLKYPRFNLGKDQMSTDTAVIVTKMICDGKNLRDLKFQDGISISISKCEEVNLPYKYLLVKGKPLLAQGIKNILKKQKTV